MTTPFTKLSNWVTSLRKVVSLTLPPHTLACIFLKLPHIQPTRYLAPRHVSNVYSTSELFAKNKRPGKVDFFSKVVHLSFVHLIVYHTLFGSWLISFCLGLYIFYRTVEQIAVNLFLNPSKNYGDFFLLDLISYEITVICNVILKCQ